jgi:hypothetical protein
VFGLIEARSRIPLVTELVTLLALRGRRPVTDRAQELAERFTAIVFAVRVLGCTRGLITIVTDFMAFVEGSSTGINLVTQVRERFAKIAAIQPSVTVQPRVAIQACVGGAVSRYSSAIFRHTAVLHATRVGGAIRAGRDIVVIRASHGDAERDCNKGDGRDETHKS